jgi:hypothetical protein
MPSFTPTHCVAALAAACLAFCGCGQSGSTPSASQTKAPSVVAGKQLFCAAPRLLPTPTAAKPLRSAHNAKTTAPLSVAVVYQQGNSTNATASGKIVELAATTTSPADQAIRQPGQTPGVASDPTPVPLPPIEATQTLELSPAAPPAAEPPLPEFTTKPFIPVAPVSPTFVAPAMQTPPAEQQQVSPQPTGPQLPWNNGGFAATAPPAYAPPAPTPPPATYAAPPVSAPTQAPHSPPTQSVAHPPNAALAPVLDRAAQIADRGSSMAQRGMLFAARAEFIKSLQLVAQALDVQSKSDTHAAALESALAALEEVRDFASHTGRVGTVKICEIATTHRTPLVKSPMANEALSPVVAQQLYLGFAQAQLVTAASGQAVSSKTLYRLGRVESLLAAHDGDSQALHAPQAMVFFQSALATDGANYLAANELAVLLTRYGQLVEARQLLLHSIAVHPHVEAWHNLAAVHQRLGEADLAQRAQGERDLLAKQNAARDQSLASKVRWVDPQTFANSAGQDSHAAGRTAATANTPPAARNLR